ncbi:MAG: M14 family zinc carboxypeptidase [Pirellulales bacterium]
MPSVTWERLGASAEGRPIEFVQLGGGPRRVLVVGSLEGDRPEGLELAAYLAAHLARFPGRAAQATVTIVRDPNPDGRLRRTTGNARGVHLEQNFPTSNWHKVPASRYWTSGREPDSEPETRILNDLLDDVAPDRILILSSAPAPASLTYAGPAEQFAGAVALQAGLWPKPLDPAAAGSLAAYAGRDRGTPIIVLGLPIRSSPHDNWSRYKRALLAALDFPEDDTIPEADAIPEDDAAQPSTGSGGRSVTAGLVRPHMLSYQRLERPGPTVAVVSPRAAQGGRGADGRAETGLTHGSRTPPAARGAQKKPHSLSGFETGGFETGLKRRLQRLPASGLFRPAGQGMPQDPIPLYPETGR